MATQTAPAASGVKAAYAEGMAALNTGNTARALEIFGSIHEANPKIAEVEYQIARIFVRTERLDRALLHAAAAARLAPAQPAVWATYAEAAALDGNPAARKAFVEALKASPLKPEQKQPLLDRFGARSAETRPATGGAPPAALKSLLALAAAGKQAEAEAAAKRILSAHRGCALAANVAGSAIAAQGRAEEAVAAYRSAIAADPGYAEAQANLALVLLRLGQADEAKAAWRAAIALAPDLVPALAGLGTQLLAESQPKQALHWLDRAAALAPKRAELHKARGNALTNLRDYEGARAAFDAAVKAAGGRAPLPLMMLAQAEAHLGQDNKAEAHFDAALALAPQNAAILGAKGVFLQGLARFAEAEATFLAAIAADPGVGENYRLYYASHKAAPGEPLIAEMERRFADPATGERDRMAFGFALAKALEDVKDHTRVFDYLDPANALMRKANPYNIAEREDQVARLMEALAGMDWTGAQIPGATETAPIFVTGMPRSGTTLVEQIIASHSRVTGAGELADGSISALRLLMGGKGGGFRKATAIAPAEFAALGQDYAAMIRARFPQADRITDKSIQTYLTLGLAKLAMPNARFIVVRRDPRDTLLSIYKNVFPSGTHLYAYDQVDLARHYTTFVKMIDFWQGLVPGWFHEIQYEDLVADPEPQSRALIAACGLDWEDACLNFHQNTRKVETLSVFQVRQPISTGSVKAWARYGDRLTPMLEQLRRDGHIED
jgi:tetratricopeptide (TPR) repeat protein